MTRSASRNGLFDPTSVVNTCRKLITIIKPPLSLIASHLSFSLESNHSHVNRPIRDSFRGIGDF